MSNGKSVLLGDYINEYENVHTIIFLNREAAGLPIEEIFDLATVNSTEIRQALALRKIRTVEERYAPESDQGYRQDDADLFTEIEGQPDKISRLNELAVQANACENTQMYRKSYRETMALVFGADRKGNM
jgi:hypothetical protein